MKGFRSIGGAQRFLATFAAYHCTSDRHEMTTRFIT
jgi:hypothetical protein